MPVLSDDAKNVLLDATLGVGQHASLPGTWYLALSNGDLASGGIEVAGGGYARAQVPLATWGAAAAGQKATVANIVFNVSSGAWDKVATHAALFDQLSGGTGYDTCELSASVTVGVSGVVVSLDAGTVIMTHG